ncbi:exodeoxyribonuclease V subunit alpha [Glaciecola sp. SC05]|uniref:exodeoxyribonuclease V subunit alpha n=1 Tax=Glaciecola sp. SC05 TaxID=1987355 RepID=UPI003529BF25
MSQSKRAIFSSDASAGLPYQNLEACLSDLVGIEAIDYFFAQYMMSLCEATPAYKSLSKEQVHLSFYSLLALSFAQRQGNSCLVVESLANKLMWSQSDKVSGSQGNAAIGYQFPDHSKLLDASLVWKAMFQSIEGIQFDGKRLYTQKFYEYERKFCEHLLHKISASEDNYQMLCAELDQQDGTQQDMHQTKTNLRDCLDKDWPALFAQTSEANSTDWQQLAVMNALVSKFAIISGGAGTGKTYTVSRLLLTLVRGLKLQPRRIGLIAPTGKAANRLASSLKFELAQFAKLPEFSDVNTLFSKVEVQTVHRLLGIHPVDGRCKYDQHRLLPFDCIILDEASMVDLSLMHKLLRATDSRCKFVMVGDPNQLPSVEAGCLLADLVASTAPELSRQSVNQLQALNPKLRVNIEHFSAQPASKNQYLVSLQQGKRSEKGVTALAEAVLGGDYAALVNTFEQTVAFHNIAIDASHSEGLVKILTDSVLPQIAKTLSAQSIIEAWQALTEYACLTPNRRGYGGVEWVNAFIERALSQKFAWVESNQPYKGKPIMINQNDYSLGLFNGDVGIMWPDNKGELWAYFPAQEAGSFQAFSLYTLPAYDPVYAMTIHKTQGSEYAQVDIILPLQSAHYLSRELLYTGVTRAKKQIRIFTDEQTLKAAVRQKIERVSGIEEILQ